LIFRLILKAKEAASPCARPASLAWLSDNHIPNQKDWANSIFRTVRDEKYPLDIGIDDIDHTDIRALSLLD
jgi:hypothetical protein